MPITQAPRAPGKSHTPRSSVTAQSTGAVVSESPRDKDRREGVEGVFSAASMLTLMRGMYADAGALSIHGPKIAREAMLLGRNNEQIGKALDILGQAGPYTGIVFATLPLIAQLAVNHGRIDASKASGIQGVMSPGALEAKVKAELAELELQALKEQQAAEATLNDLKLTQERSQANGDASVAA
jgi:hypothetical protein